MAIVKPAPRERTTIDIDGPNGNAFALLLIARDFTRMLGLDANEVTEEMQAGDYVNLLRVFDKYFGEFVDLETNSEHLIEELSNAQPTA